VSPWRHVASILPLPGVVTVGIPALIVWRTGAELGWLSLLGVPLIAAGLLLVAATLRLFASVGRGTLAPWDLTTRLVVRGPYRYRRNPILP
jgi:protein-S-isoprenylcysteine O-methyltransferase Ste14